MGRAERSQVGIQAASDIDSTLAGGIIPAHMRVYNPELRLGLSDEYIDGLAKTPGIKKTFDVPELDAFRKQSPAAEAEFQRVRAIIRTSKEIHANLPTEPGSEEGIRRLRDRYGNMHYYTVRPKEIGLTTVDWLGAKDFPDSRETVICTSHRDKLIRIAMDFVLQRGDSGVNTDPGIKAIHWDDSYTELAEAAAYLAGKYAVMRRAFSGMLIVAYGAPEGHEHGNEESGLRFINQPDWEESSVDHTIEELDAIAA